MYDTCNRYILILIPQRVFLLFLFDGEQTVSSSLSVYGDTCAVVLDVFVSIVFSRFITSNLGIVRSSGEFRLLLFVVSLFVKFLAVFLCLLFGFFLFVFRFVFLSLFHG